MKKLSHIFIFSMLILATSCSGKVKRPPPVMTIEHSLESYGRKISKAHDLEFVAIKDPWDHTAVPSHSIAFRSERLLTLDECRDFAFGCVNELWNELKNDPNILFYTDFQQNTASYNPKELALKSVSFSIQFLEKNKKRPQEPFLGKVIFTKKAFYYYQTNPRTQDLILVFHESYEDAKNRLSDLDIF